jgi:hypothetical protein
MSDLSSQATDFLRPIPRERSLDYLGALSSIILIALMMTCLVAALYQNGAVAPYDVAIPSRGPFIP